MSESTSAALQQAWALIQADRKAEALDIVKPICTAEPTNAQAWYTAANALDDPRLKRAALERALKADRFHDLARGDLNRLDKAEGKLPTRAETPALPPTGAIIQQAAAVPEPTGEDDFDAPRKKFQKKKARSTQRELLIVGSVVVEVTLIAVVYLLFFSPRPALPHPMLGPYYPRSAAIPATADRPPCKAYTLTGHIVDGPGLYAHFWNDRRSLDVDVPANGQGDFTTTASLTQLPTSQLGIDRSEDFHLRLHDAQNQPMSGIMDTLAYKSCTFAIQFEKYTPKARDPNIPTYLGHYVLTYSELTQSDIYICKFTGFMGSVFDDNGPVGDVVIDVWGQTGTGRALRTTSSDAPELGPGGWSVFMLGGGTYYLNILMPDGLPVDTHLLNLPLAKDCTARLIKVAITQFDP